MGMGMIAGAHRQRLGEGTGLPGAGVTGGSELLMWALGTELGSFVRAIRTLKP